MSKLPTVALVAAIFALVAAILVEVASLRQPLFFILTVIPIWAGLGILLRRVWSAYGFALYQLASLLSMPFVMNSAKPIVVAFSALFALFLAILFFFAGRALAQTGSQRGWALPWIAISLATSVPFIFLHAFRMPNGSMENTLLVGDQLLVRVFPRASVRDGDIVVFHYPIDRSQIFIKRVVGQAGDHIRIADRQVYRNETKLEEPYVPTVESLGELPRAPIVSDVIVPKRKYFVLGDNRDASLDSRYWGLLDESDVIGKPIMIYYSAVESTSKFTLPQIRWPRLMKPL